LITYADIFPPTQAYALLVLPHGGPDLEAYTFPVKTGWRQACSIFWQIAKALATAEELVSFEVYYKVIRSVIMRGPDV
jgi:serine/threonine-protein kinase haspin